MHDTLLTREVATQLGTTPGCLLAAIRQGRIAPPALLRGNCFFWTPVEIELARVGLAVDRRRRQTLPIPEVRGQCHVPTRLA